MFQYNVVGIFIILKQIKVTEDFMWQIPFVFLHKRQLYYFATIRNNIFFMFFEVSDIVSLTESFPGFFHQGQIPV